MAEVPPELTARADQIRAHCSEDLDKAVQKYREMVAERAGADPNIPWGYLIASLRNLFTTESGQRAAVFTLAAAIERLAR